MEHIKYATGAFALFLTSATGSVVTRTRVEFLLAKVRRSSNRYLRLKSQIATSVFFVAANNITSQTAKMCGLSVKTALTTRLKLDKELTLMVVKNTLIKRVALFACQAPRCLGHPRTGRVLVAVMFSYQW